VFLCIFVINCVLFIELTVYYAFGEINKLNYSFQTSITETKYKNSQELKKHLTALSMEPIERREHGSRGVCRAWGHAGPRRSMVNRGPLRFRWYFIGENAPRAQRVKRRNMVQSWHIFQSQISHLFTIQLIGALCQRIQRSPSTLNFQVFPTNGSL